MSRIDLPSDLTAAARGDELPDLPTMVALAGTVHRAEVGGNVCFNTVITIAIIYGEG